ncbi:MAG: Na+/H+ antiporter NhaA, partial [Mycetocola sp.]
IPVAIFAFVAHRFRRFFGIHQWAAWVILLPLGLVAWGLLHASGIHATIAGVVLGFAVPVIRSQASGGPAAGPGLAETFEHRFRPISAGFAVPVFAFFSAGVAIGGWDGFVGALTDPVTIGIIAALVLGKPVGIVVTTWLMSRFTRANLDPSLRWVDLIGIGLLAGIGFTVSLLVAELSFGLGAIEDDHAKVGILLASVIAAVLASVLLVSRNRRYRRIEEEEKTDADRDGIPDVYQRED